MDFYEAVSFWQWSDNALGVIHLYAAVSALMIGPIVFLRQKGDVTHRLLGMVFVIAMYITNITALRIYSFTGSFHFFHYAALGSLATLTLGFVAIVAYGANKSRIALDLHLQMMPWSYLGLALAAIAESAIRGLPRLYAGIEDIPDFWQRTYMVIGISGTAGFIVTFILVFQVRNRWMSATHRAK